MDDALYTQINEAIKDRTDWEVRQGQWYRMRHRGLRRSSKPYPGCPDLHFPLIDSTIEKLKPFYVQQLYTGETLATFLSLKSQDSELTTQASYWFDYKLKQETNFERETSHAIDGMLNAGLNPIKARWDCDCKKISFDACNPLHVIVPKWTQEIQDADWLVHVLHLSEAEYRANPNFNQDDDFIKSIKGKGTKQGATGTDGETDLCQTKARREGINCGQNEQQIVLWEIYKRDRQSKRITIETCAPVLPKENWQVRGDYQLPYNQGIFANGTRMPFGAFRTEIKDKGYYAPRGIPEIQAAFEVSMCKTWNKIHEWMDYFTQPTHTATKPLPNAANFQRRPGGILPEGLVANDPPPAPAILMEQLEYTRSVGEQRVQLPDLGASEHLTPGASARGGGKVTATQINAILGQSGQSNDIRARVFRMDLGDLFNMAWSLMLQYCVPSTVTQGQPDNSLQFLVNDELQTLDPQAIHDAYQIVPNGSPDSWNRGAELQKVTAVYQMLQGNPDIDPSELTKLLLEKGDPRWVKRLFKPSQEQAAEQTEEQHAELLLMLGKFSAQVEPGDDDKAHLAAVAQWGQQRMQEGQPTDPIQSMLILQHIQGHLGQLQQKKDPAFRQAVQQMGPMMQILSQLAAQGQQQPSNVVQGPGGQPIPSGGTPMASTTANGKPPDPVGDGTKIANSLASLIKAGVPITNEEINKALSDMNLPPLPNQPIQQPLTQIVDGKMVKSPQYDQQPAPQPVTA